MRMCVVSYVLFIISIRWLFTESAKEMDDDDGYPHTE